MKLKTLLLSLLLITPAYANYDKTVELAEQGYTQAQLLLGTAYLGGIKTDKDLEEANKWFNKAIESDKTLADLMNSLKGLVAERVK